MSNVTKIKDLRRNAEELATIIDRYNEAIKPENVDKYREGFNVDHHGRSHFVIQASYYACKGVYGNSSSHGFGMFDSKVVEPYLVRALNEMRGELFQRAAKMMREDAAKLVGDAREEIRLISEALDEAEAITEIAAE